MASQVPTHTRHIEHTREDGGASFTIIYVRPEDDPDRGIVMLEICSKCSWIHAECEHKVNDWYDAAGEFTPSGVTGATLRCRLCGIDGT